MAWFLFESLKNYQLLFAGILNHPADGELGIINSPEMAWVWSLNGPNHYWHGKATSARRGKGLKVIDNTGARSPAECDAAKR